MNNAPSADATLTDGIAPSAMDNTPRPTATNITVFVEHFDNLDAFYGNSFTRMENDIPRTCQLPHGGTCILQHSNASALTSDVVFRMVVFINPGDTVIKKLCPEPVGYMCLTCRAAQKKLFQRAENNL